MATQIWPGRREVLLGAAALGLPLAAAARAAPPANPLRSIDPSDEDFSDLEPVARAIGAARVVQLGEPSHGAGAAFAAKVRLAKFLHRRLGFDLLVWESGFYDVTLVQAGLRAGEDPVAAGRRGVFALWSAAEQVRPLFAYAQASLAGPRPLEMAGYDLQVTASGVRERFATDLAAFAAAPKDADLRALVSARADTALKARERLYATKFAEAADFDVLDAAAGELLATIRAQPTAFGNRLDAEFMARCIDNMRLDALQRLEAARLPPADVTRENRRDAQNFANLRWLLERRHPGRKAIVWAHNAHVMNAHYAPDFRAARARGEPGDMTPTGVLLADWLGRGVYTIGVTAYDGEDGWATSANRTPVPPAPAGSLEARLHALGRPYQFLDLRGAGRDPALLRGVATARFPKYDANPAADLARAYDGLVFIDRMTPATARRA